MNTLGTDYDVVIVGAGLAGLQAGISFASDGTKVLVVDKRAVGGQAGESALIENLIGFPKGVSGRELADSGIIQMQRFGGEFKVPFEVQRVMPNENGTFTIIGEDRSRITCKAVVLSVGVQYLLLEAQNTSIYVNRGINYGTPSKEPSRWANKRIAIVGGANSAAQAARFLAETCVAQVEMLVRGPRIDEKMSTYMAEDISALPNIHVHLETEVHEVFGDASGFKGVILKKKDGSVERMELDHMHILIGATPHTAWLDGTVALDERGFIFTDRDLPEGAWTNKARMPHNFETSVPGIFAVGDAEQSSVKRASAAIGYGSCVTPSVRRYLDELRTKKVFELKATG